MSPKDYLSIIIGKIWYFFETSFYKLALGLVVGKNLTVVLFLSSAALSFSVNKISYSQKIHESRKITLVWHFKFSFYLFTISTR